MYSDGLASWTRNLPPAHEVEPLQQLGVADAVRLTTPEYDARAFEGAGIRHRGFLLERCTAPPRPLVAAFLGIATRRAVAGHCRAGRGRTDAPLIAAHCMRLHGFTARALVAAFLLLPPRPLAPCWGVPPPHHPRAGLPGRGRYSRV